MKKEIGIEKLIELLNEYGHTSSCGPFETYRIEPATDYISSYLVLSRDDNGEGDWKDWHLEIPRLISKEYGFIGWLVENDKIYREKINDKWGDMSVHFTDEELFVMSLSISNSPIEDLISYLK